MVRGMRSPEVVTAETAAPDKVVTLVAGWDKVSGDVLVTHFRLL